MVRRQGKTPISPPPKLIARFLWSGQVKLYYTVRELSSHAVELWALRALGGEIVIRSRGRATGHVWLREHLRENYTAAWHEVLASGEVDAAVQTPAFTSRWDNYWIEGPRTFRKGQCLVDAISLQSQLSSFGVDEISRLVPPRT